MEASPHLSPGATLEEGLVPFHPQDPELPGLVFACLWQDHGHISTSDRSLGNGSCEKSMGQVVVLINWGTWDATPSLAWLIKFSDRVLFNHMSHVTYPTLYHF